MFQQPLKRLFLCGVLTASFAQLNAQELIRGLNAMNAASIAPAGLPYSGVAPGSRAVILGRDLGPDDAVRQETPNDLTLAGVSAKVTVDNSSVDAWVMSVQKQRVEILVPRSVPSGKGTVQLNINGTSLTAPIEILPRAFGILTNQVPGLGISGQGRAVVLDASASPVTITNPAFGKEVFRVRGTGLGVRDSFEGWQVLVAGRTMPAVAVTRLSNGYDDLAFEFPEGLAGCALPIAVRAITTEGGVFLSNYAYIAAGERGQRCQDPGAPENIDWGRFETEGARIGTLSLSRGHFDGGEFQSKTDLGTASFYKVEPGSYSIDSLQYGGSTTVGSCTVISALEQDIAGPVTSPLDAGVKLSVRGPQGEKEMNLESKGSYAGRFGETVELPIPGFPMPGGQLYLDPGNYTIAGNGGEDVAQFEALLTVPKPATWTNASTIGDDCNGKRCIDRTKDLTVEWQGGEAPYLVTVMGMGVAPNARPAAMSMFLCIEPVTKGKLTVPAEILSSLPASGDESILGFSVSLPGAGQQFRANGLDLGFVSYSESTVKLVAYR